MLLYKAVSAVLAAEILFSLFNISSPMKNMSERNLAAESITDVHKSEYAHLLNDERFNDYFFEEVDPDADEALASEYKEKLIKKYADDIISDSRIGEYINIQDFYSTSPVYRLKELETLSTYVFQNYDGTNTTYYMSETVKYISDDGMIREKNIRLEQSSKGYIVNESDVQLTIPNSPLDEVIMNTVLGKVKISVSSKTDRTELPKTVFLETENSVTYYNIFDKGQHLKYTPLLSGLKEDIIIDSKPVNNSFSVIFDTNALKSCENNGITYLFKEDGENNSYLSFGQLWIYDSKGKFGTGTIIVEPDNETGKYVVSFYLPDSFIESSEISYPLTLSSQIQIRSGYDSNDIVDASVYQNVPNMNAGGWLYNNIGHTDSTYGLARTVIRLNGLINSSIYQALNASDITSVYFNVREATGNSYKTVKIHPMTGIPTWTESTVTWNNYGSFDANYNYGGSIGYDEWASFNITNLVKAWKNNSFNSNGCFIFIMGGTENSECRALYSSEYSSSTYRPYVQITYQNPTITLMYNNLTIEVGQTVSELAVVNPFIGTCNWSISPMPVATAAVSQSSSNVCYVTGVAPGKATLLVILYDGSNAIAAAMCFVTVILPQGVYYIKNSNNLYVKTDGTINDGNSIIQGNIGITSMLDIVKIRYLWKIKYLGSDRYSIRSMSKPDMGIINGYSNSVVLSGIGINDNLSQLTSNQKWGIAWNAEAGGIVIYKDADNVQVIKGENDSLTSGTNLVTGNITSNSQWLFLEENNPPEGVTFYNADDGTNCSSSMVFMVKGQNKTLQELDIIPVVYRIDTNSQVLVWQSGNTSIADISPIGDLISVKATGITDIIANSISNDITLSGSFQIDVAPLANDVYYFQNADSETFMYASYPGNGISLGLENYNVHLNAQWKLEYIGNSFYTINWFYNSNYYAGISGDTNSNNSSVVLRSGYITDGMKWKFEDNGYGYYTITPKCAISVNRHMNKSGASIKLSDTTASSSKWMLWDSDFANWTPSFWYSDKNEIWYWDTSDNEDIIISSNIQYEGIVYNYDSALSNAINQWEQALDISTNVIQFTSNYEISYNIASTIDLEFEFEEIPEFHYDTIVIGIVPYKNVVKEKVCYCVAGINKVITVYRVDKAEVLIRTDPGIPYSENRLATHEMGHAFGFYGHIPYGIDSGSVMNHDQAGTSYVLSSFDKNHLCQLYNAVN